MPDAFYTAFESSFFGPAIAKTIPVLYDSTSPVHPRKPAFMKQVENTLLLEGSSGDLSEDREAVHRAIYNIDRFFNPAY